MTCHAMQYVCRVFGDPRVREVNLNRDVLPVLIEQCGVIIKAVGGVASHSNVAIYATDTAVDDAYVKELLCVGDSKALTIGGPG